MPDLQCAICLHVRFASAEYDRPQIGCVSQAVTILDGTALCALHIEDADQANGNRLLSIAKRIIGVS